MMTTKRKTDRKGTETEREDTGGGILGSLTGFLENLGDFAEAGERFSRRKATGHTEEKVHGGEKTGGENRFSRILSGLTDIAEKLNEISDKGEGVSKKGEFTFPSKEGGIKGVYGFSLKTGLGGKDDRIKVEPFGNIRKDEKTGEAVVREIHEPLVDVFEDNDATTLIAEMPGVGPDDIKIDVREDVLTISAKKGAKKYQKELLLSHFPAKDRIKVTCNNGIVTIRCEKTE
jgi:HSP20 family protein